MKRVVALLVPVALVILCGSHPAPAEPLDVSDCESACRECARPCKTIACEKACSAALVGCCVGYGKKPPSSTSCWCR